MKKLLPLILLVSGSSFASGVTVHSFEIVRSGGGQVKITVSEKDDGKVHAVMAECHSNPLSEPIDLVLSAADALDSRAVLNGNATLASNQSDLDPNLLSGTWSSLVLSYSYEESDGALVETEKEIKRPLVIIKSRVSPVLSSIEKQMREVSASVCK